MTSLPEDARLAQPAGTATQPTALRWLDGMLALVMIAFAAVQYNDPDWWLWVVYYIVPAFWALVAGFRQGLLQHMRWRGALWACVAGWTGLVYIYWPQVPDFWRQDVWWQEETAREGMGLMVALGVLLVALMSAYRRR